MAGQLILHEKACRMCSSQVTRAACQVDGFQFYECVNCGFMFCPQILRHNISQMYANGERDIEAGAPELGWADPSFLAPALDELALEVDSLMALDFGAGQSRIPDLLREEGHKVVAVDIVPPQVEHEDRLTGDLLDLNLCADSFDLAYSFQVFEHLPEPKPVLFELLRLVRDQGLVLIHTDMETNERDAQGFENWWYVTPPDHCSFYRNKTFDVALADLPHEICYRDDKSVMIRKRGTHPAHLS